MSKPKFEFVETLVDKTMRIEGSHGAALGNREYSEITAKLLHNMRSVSKRLGHDLSVADVGWIVMEYDWHCCGRPYYKIWPEMIEMLKHTSLMFDPSYLNAPHDVYVVMLPLGTYRVQNVMVRIVDKQHDRAEQCSKIFAKENCDKVLFATYKEPDEAMQHLVLPLYVDRSVEESLNTVLMEDFPVLRYTSDPNDDPAGICLSKEQRMEVWRLAISAAMFGVDKHELVAPDIDKEVLIKQYPAGRSKASQKLAEEKRQEAAAKVFGWRIGSEVDLPRPVKILQGEPRQLGEELTYGYIRSGHMRMQPCGPNRQDRKLIFVGPTIVRSDLPQRVTRGYRIRKRKGAQ